MSQNNRQHKWQMNRAGLTNFWYYEDETFEFADGKMLLRGSNGSGKSVTMQSILPVLLDGRKSPDRLDPFGSRARKMEDYLLGEKDIVDRDERTGYLFLEYKRKSLNQYITTGIGMQARRNKSMNTWYFIITDNRRIGEDIQLYEVERGERIPLSRKQLENRIADGGHVVSTQSEYMKLVNKYIFGFAEMEAYEDLMKLLIQLRSPKLSKDFKPTVIYNILEAALPPLTDEDLRHLSDTIEQMDQTKQQIEQLEREHVAVSKLIGRYDQYNQYKVVGIAQAYRKTKKQNKERQSQLEYLTSEITTTGVKLASQTSRKTELDQSLDVLTKKQERLKHHKVWNLQKEQENEQHHLADLVKEYEKKDTLLGKKKTEEIRLKETSQGLENELKDKHDEMDDIFLDLDNLAETAAFTGHTINADDFRRKTDESFDFTIWKKETENHYQFLDDVTEKFRTFVQLKKEITTIQTKMGQMQQEIDHNRLEEKDWTQIFEQDKQTVLQAIHAWVDMNSFLTVPETILQETARKFELLYEPEPFETIRDPFVQVNQQYQMEIQTKIATEKSRHESTMLEIEQVEQELAEWQHKKDPEPDTRRAETVAARSELQAGGYSFLPFYEAVEFREHVPVDVRKQIEAALLDSGLIDALITEGDVPLKHDKILTPKPAMMAYTLADFLVPDLENDVGISGERIDGVLQSILVGETDEAGFSLTEDGHYQIGPVTGHAIPVDSVRFIGKSARKRYREVKIAAIKTEIANLQDNLHVIDQAIQGYHDQITTANEAMAVFPVDLDLRESFTHIKEKRFQISRMEKDLMQTDGQLREVTATFQATKRELADLTRPINLVFTLDTYQAAKKVMRDYEKSLHLLETAKTTVQHIVQSMNQTTQRLEMVIDEVDDVSGELYIIQDKKTISEKNIVEIEEQLQLHGVEDIRTEIKHVQANLDSANTELADIREQIPQLRTNKQTLIDQKEIEKQKYDFTTHMMEAWKDILQREVQYDFLPFPESSLIDDIAMWVEKNYRQNFEGKASNTIVGQLSSTFHKQKGDLMEYRMTESYDFPLKYDWMDLPWTDEQQIQLENYRQKAQRRLIKLDFQGKRVSPYYVRDMLETDQQTQKTLLDEKDRKLYEEILFHSVGKKLRSRISRAQHWTEKMDKLMQKTDSSSGLTFSIRWKPRTAETEEELDTKELVTLLRQDQHLLKEEDLNKVIDHFRSKINRAKELVETKDEGTTLLQVLKEVLDYRNWFSFILSYRRENETKRELTNHAFFKFSGGEKAMAMYIPLFTACYSRYSEADADAPFIISLDEAFAGVDEDNISAMFKIVEELDFDYMMNSQVLWGDYATISRLAIYELVRPKNRDYVTTIHYHWDGRERKLLDESIMETVEV